MSVLGVFLDAPHGLWPNHHLGPDMHLIPFHLYFDDIASPDRCGPRLGFAHFRRQALISKGLSCMEACTWVHFRNHKCD
jgi:hypothetical protein